MKKLTQISLFAFALVFSQVGLLLANDHEGTNTLVSVRQIKSEPKKAVISIANLPDDQQAFLKIRNEKGRVLHKEVINKQQAFARKYDFSALRSGEYTVEIRTKAGIVTESFTLQPQQATPLYFKPAIQVVPDMVKVAFINPMNTPVLIKMYDQVGKVIYKEEVSSQEKYVKGLDISSLEAGLYSLAILGNDYVYTKSIDVE